MLDCQKHLFNLSPDQTFLNGAYMSPLTNRIVEVGRETLSRLQNPGVLSTADFFVPGAQIKSSFSKLINNPQPERIALIPSVSYGMANVAANLALQKGQQIIIAADQFPSNVYPWQKLTESKGAHLNIIAPPKIASGRAERWNELLLTAIDDNTAAVAISQLHWSDGSWFDLKAIRARSREVGALLIVDGTQSVGAYPFDIKEIQPDALVCAAYKWLLGPYGIGLAYYGEAFDNGRPVEESWINRLNSDDFRTLSSYQSAYRPLAARYAVGENSQLLLLPLLQAGLDHLLEWGVENIQKYCSGITQPAVAELENEGCQLEQYPWRAAHLFGVRLQRPEQADAIATALKESNIIFSLRGDAIRISPYIYNDEADLEKMMQCFRPHF